MSSLLFVLMLELCVGAQDRPISQTEHFSSKDNYKDFVVVDGRIWALTTTGKLRVFDLRSGDKVTDVPRIDSPIAVIAKDKDSNIVVGYDHKLLWSNGQRDAVGSPMNMFKMAFVGDGTMVFGTQLNGIGVWDGRRILMIK